MRALNSRLVLIDINRSWQASRRLISATATAFSSDSSSSFRRTHGARQRISSSKSPASPFPIRRPSDGFSFDISDLLQVAEVMGLEEDMMMLEKQMSILASS
ncbi:unnamed protein product, partial [Brassica oleracea var. botrytis]